LEGGDDGDLTMGDGGRQKLVRGRWRAAKIGSWAMAGGKNWSAGDGGRKKLVRGQALRGG